MMFFLAMFVLYASGTLLLLAIGALVCALERAFTDTKRLNAREMEQWRKRQPQVDSIDYRDYLRDIERSQREISNQLWRQNVRHYWNDWNRNNDCRNFH